MVAKTRCQHVRITGYPARKRLATISWSVAALQLCHPHLLNPLLSIIHLLKRMVKLEKKIQLLHKTHCQHGARTAVDANRPSSIKHTQCRISHGSIAPQRAASPPGPGAQRRPRPHRSAWCRLLEEADGDDSGLLGSIDSLVGGRTRLGGVAADGGEQPANSRLRLRSLARGRKDKERRVEKRTKKKKGATGISVWRTACTSLVGTRGEATETKKNVVVGAGRSEKRMHSERSDGATDEMRRDMCFSCSKWMSGFTQKGRARVEGLSESTTIPLPPPAGSACCPFAKTRIAAQACQGSGSVGPRLRPHRSAAAGVTPADSCGQGGGDPSCEEKRKKR